MHRSASTLIALLFAAFVVAFSAGCSADAKKARHLKRAQAYFSSGEYDKAEIEYSNVLLLEAMNPEAIAKLGQIYFEQTRIGRVYPYLSKAKELQPDNLDVRVQLGMFLVGVGRPKDAREEANFVLARRPSDAEAPLFLADSVQAESDIVMVRGKLNELPAAVQNTAPVLTALGFLEMRQQRIKEALALYEKALQHTPSFVPALLGRANAQLVSGDLKGAEESFKAAAMAAPARSPRRLQYVKFKLQTGDLAGARTFLEGITASTPDLLAAWVMLADIAALEKKYDESLAALQKVLARDQNHPEAMLLSGRIRMMNGEKEKAVAELERATKTYPQSPQLHHQLAVAYIAVGDITKAHPAATQAVALAPRYVDAVTLLADLNLRQRNYEAAISSLRQLVQQYPKLPGPQLLLAQGLRAQGNLDAALNTYRELEALLPKDPQIPLLAGLVLLQQNKPAEARNSFDRALKLSPDFLPATEQLVNLDIADKKFDTAKQRIAPLLAQRSDVAGLHLMLAKVHLAQGDQGQAEKALLAAAKLQPDLPLTYMLLARIYMNSRQPEKAIANLEQAAAKDPKDVQAVMLTGILHEQQNNFPGARASYERVLAINPKFAAALNNLAYVLAEKFNETDKAFELAQRARELQPGEPHVADTLGWVLYRKGQYSWASILLAESADRLPDVPEVHFHFGMSVYMLGDEARARAALTKALQLNPVFTGSDRAKQALVVLEIQPTTADQAQVKTLQEITAAGGDAVAWSKLAQVRRRSGALEEARKAYEAALKISPDNVSVALDLVALLVELKKTDEAVALGRNTRKLSPTDPGVALRLGQAALAAGDQEWAASLLQEAVLGRADDPAAAFLLAEASYNLGRFEIADRETNRALELDANFPAAAQAREYQALRAIAKAPSAGAKSNVDQILARDPRHPAALMASAAVAEHIGDRATAFRAYETLLSTRPSFVPALRGFALLAAAEVEPRSQALDYAVKAREALRDDDDLTRATGILLYRANQHARAAPLLREVSRRRPEDAQLLYYLGRAELGAKDSAAAKRALEKALTLGLSVSDAAEARRLLAEKK